MPALARTRVEGVGELPGAVADQEPEVRGAVAEVYQEVADLLGGPRPVRVRGDPGDVDVAGVGFQNSATSPDLGFYAARSYLLMSPPRTGRRWIHFRERSATG